MPDDAFPQTMQTWISDRMREGMPGRGAINRHVMSVYRLPLEVYCRGCSCRSLGDPSEIVTGFFADRLERPGFFDAWQESGLQLRRWLMNGLSFYLKEMMRRKRRDERVVGLDEDPWTAGGAPEQAMDRAFVTSVVQAALERACETCRNCGLEQHWHVFVAHHYEGRSYAELAGELGVTQGRCAVMTRTATSKFRAAVRDIIASDGIQEDRIDEEIASLLHVHE